MLSHAADRLMDSKSLAQFAGDPSVSVLGVIRRGSVAMELCLLCLLATDRVSALALRFSPTKHIPQPGIQLLKWEGMM